MQCIIISKFFFFVLFFFLFLFLNLIVIILFLFYLYRFVLLNDPKDIIVNSKFSGVATNLTNEVYNITLQPDFNSTDRNDNPFSYFPTAIEAAYFWIFGEWIQKDHFDSPAINTFTLIASIFLVIILQNMLIAFMR